MAQSILLLTRADGSQARITANRFFCPVPNHFPIDLYVHTRSDAAQPWVLAPNTPAPGWKAMPRAQYLREGRSPMLQAVSFAEMARCTAALPPI